MATYTYAPTVNELIYGALEILRVVDIENSLTPTTNQITKAMNALNMLLKSWENDQFQLFLRSKSITPLTLVKGVYEYNQSGVGWTSSFQKIYSAYRTTDGKDYPLQIITEKEYHQLVDKTSEGTPIAIYYERPKVPDIITTIVSTGKFFIYKAPDSYHAANTTITVYGQKPFYVASATTDIIELPNNWLDAVKYNLAVRLAHGYGIPSTDFDRIKAIAKELREEALGTDSEEGSLYLYPAQQ